MGKVQEGERGTRGLDGRSSPSEKRKVDGRLPVEMAHDLNNLLAVIEGYSRLLLKDSGLDELTRHRLDLILQASQQAASLLDPPPGSGQDRDLLQLES
jgi:signal transduction histidine kinase